jgi:uncharacterized protein YecE (DUF72 family)
MNDFTPPTATGDGPRPGPGDTLSGLDGAIGRATEWLMARQHGDGHWLFELEADATIPAEYLLLVHWLGETPAHFRFGVKAHQVITHIKRLKKTEDFVPRFLSTIELLARAEKLGPLLFQLPPNLKADSALLEEFLSVLPRAVPSAFEFRHASWFDDAIFELLKKHNRALCVAETEERTTPDVVTADFCYYRYRKPTYTLEERHAMIRRIREHLAAGRNVFAYFKHEETPEGALSAVELLKEVL